MTWLWISLYVVAALVSVPLIARFAYWCDFSKDRSACVGVALITCYAWPIFALFGLLYLVSHKLAPVIFRGTRAL